MIVIAIIGILAAIAVPNYQNYVNRSRLTEGFNLTRPLRTQVEEYFNATGNLYCCGWSQGTVTGGPADITSPSNTISLIRWNGINSTGGQIEIWYNNIPYQNSYYPILLLQASISNNKLVWQCTRHAYDTIPHNILPSGCNNPPAF